MMAGKRILLILTFLLGVSLALFLYELLGATTQLRNKLKDPDRTGRNINVCVPYNEERNSVAEYGKNSRRGMLDELRGYLNSIKPSLNQDSTVAFPYTPLLMRLKDDIRLSELLEKVLSEYVGDSKNENELFTLLLYDPDKTLKECLLYGLSWRDRLADKQGFEKVLTSLLRNAESKEELYAVVASCILHIAWGAELRKANVAFLGMTTSDPNDNTMADLTIALTEVLVREQDDDFLKSYLKDFLFGKSEFVMRSSIGTLLDIFKFDGITNWHDNLFQSNDSSDLAEAALYSTTDSYFFDSLTNTKFVDKVRTILSDVKQKEEATRRNIVSSLIWLLSTRPVDDEVKACSLLLIEALENLEPTYAELARIQVYRAMKNDPAAHYGLLEIIRKSHSSTSILLAGKYYADSLPIDQRTFAIQTLIQIRPEKSSLFEILKE